MCDCRTNMTKALLDRFKESAPEATGHEIEMLGYALIFRTPMTEMAYMKVIQTANFPLKKRRHEVKINACKFTI